MTPTVLHRGAVDAALGSPNVESTRLQLMVRVVTRPPADSQAAMTAGGTWVVARGMLERDCLVSLHCSRPRKAQTTFYTTILPDAKLHEARGHGSWDGRRYKASVAGTCRWTCPPTSPLLAEGVGISIRKPGLIPCSCAASGGAVVPLHQLEASQPWWQP